MSEPKQSREEWLQHATRLAEPLFGERGYKVPAVRLSCGWPSTRALSKKKRCVGEAWSVEAAADGVVQIFISPYVADPGGPNGVLGVLVHELVHAVVGNKESHNKVFGKCARAMGLEGKLTATIAGDKLCATFKQWIETLGEYPHAKLDAALRPTKKQSTRMIKLCCDDCGYTVRTSRKWLEVGPAHCPNHGAMTAEEPAEDEDES